MNSDELQTLIDVDEKAQMERKKLRAELAAAALSGLIKHYSPTLDPSRIAGLAVQIADAVMDRLDD